MRAGTAAMENLCDGIETVKGFCYLADRLNASGGSEAAAGWQLKNPPKNIKIKHLKTHLLVVLLGFLTKTQVKLSTSCRITSPM